MTLSFSSNLVKLGGSVSGRILQLFQGLVVDGACAIVDKGATQKHSQGKDPRVILRVTLEITFKQVVQDFTPKLKIDSSIDSIMLSCIISVNTLTMHRHYLKTDANTDISFDNYKDIFYVCDFFMYKVILIFIRLSFPSMDEGK